MIPPDKTLLWITEALLPILTGSIRSTITGLLEDAEKRGQNEGILEERKRVVASLRQQANNLKGGFPKNASEVLEAAANHFEQMERLNE